MSGPTVQAERAKRRRTWPTWAKVIVSILLLVHMTAIVATESAEPPASNAEIAARDFFIPYINFINQHNTHRYYSPQPGATPTLLFVIRYKDPDRPNELVRLPDLKIRPRIRMQRQFAIAANVLFEYQVFSRRLLGRNTPTDLLYPRLFARRLYQMHPDCDSIEAILRMHEFPPPEVAYKAAAETGTLDLDDKDAYFTSVELGVFTCDELRTP